MEADSCGLHDGEGGDQHGVGAARSSAVEPVDGQLEPFDLELLLVEVAVEEHLCLFDGFLRDVASEGEPAVTTRCVHRLVQCDLGGHGEVLFLLHCPTLETRHSPHHLTRFERVGENRRIFWAGRHFIEPPLEFIEGRIVIEVVKPHVVLSDL